jgi:hypothetical protein
VLEKFSFTHYFIIWDRLLNMFIIISNK